MTTLKDSSAPAARLANWNTIIYVLNEIQELLNLDNKIVDINEDTKNLLLAGDEDTCETIQD